MRRIFYFSSIVFLAVLFNACQYTAIVSDPSGNVEVPEDLSFASDIAPIFQEQSCTNCHPGMSQPDLSAGSAYNSLINGGYINTGNPEESELLTEAASDGTHAAKLTSEQEAYILAWIEQGAENN